MIDKSQRTYISDRFVLELDDGGGSQFVGTLQTVEGIGLKSDVVDEKVGGEVMATKYPGRPKFDDVTIQVGMSMAPKFWKWIKATFNQYDAQRKNGAIVALDFDNNQRWRRTFSGALITEVGFPALDGAAKEPAYLTVKFAVESMKLEKASGKYPAEREAQAEWQKQRMWLPSNFTFKLDKFGSRELPNAKVDAFTVKQNIIVCPTGGILEPTKEPGRIEFPNLSVTVMERDADVWRKWWDDFVREAKHEGGNETTGHISYLKRQTKDTPLVVLDIYNLGILSMSPVKHDSKQQQIQKMKIDLYCEWMDLNSGEGTVG
jgi:phage tail-like protein